MHVRFHAMLHITPIQNQMTMIKGTHLCHACQSCDQKGERPNYFSSLIANPHYCVHQVLPFSKLWWFRTVFESFPSLHNQIRQVKAIIFHVRRMRWTSLVAAPQRMWRHDQISPLSAVCLLPHSHTHFQFSGAVSKNFQSKWTVYLVKANRRNHLQI